MFASQPGVVNFEFHVTFSHEAWLLDYHASLHFIALPQFLPQRDPLVDAISPHQSQAWHGRLSAWSFPKKATPTLLVLAYIGHHVVKDHHHEAVVVCQSF